MHRALFITLIALGCSDATDVEPAPIGQPDTTPTVQAPPPPAADEPERAPLGARALMLVGDASVVVRPGDELELAVDYIDDKRAPIADAVVSAQILEGDGSLVGRRVLTGTDGRAFIDLTLGAPGRVRVEAAAEGAASVYWDVVVAAGGTGELLVDVQGVTAPRGVVQLFPSPMCAAVRAGNAGAPHLEAGVFDNSARISDLADGARVAVAVQLHAPSGGAVASGCVEDIEVVGGATTRVVVDVSELALEVKGRYAVDHALDLGHLVPGGPDGVVDIVARVGGGIDGSRGRAIVDVVCDHADINMVVCTLLRALGGPIIDDVIDRQVEPAVLRALTTFGDVYRIIRSPLVEGEIEVTASTPDADGGLAGNVHRLSGVRFVWRDGCRAQRPGDCERSFDLRDLGLRGELPRAVFDATIDGAQLEIGAHQIELPMESVALMVAEQWVLPATLGRDGPVTLEALMRELLPCADISAALPLGSLSEGLCEEVLPSALADLLRERLAATGGVDLLSLEGTARVWDHDGDRRADALLDGEWTGGVSGTFTGCRDGADCR